jgi:multimeric flavodoxin WrbA
MKITILNGNASVENAAFDYYLQELAVLLRSRHHKVTIFDLKEMDIRYCIGCFDCWVKTPGLCTTKDDSSEVCFAYIHSDLVLFASPILMGYTSALLKKAHERLLPLMHPYFEFVEREIHHRSRYKAYPLIGLLLEREPDADESVVEIITNIYRRDAINLKTSFTSTWQLSQPIKETADEIDRLQRLPAGRAQ